MKSILSGFLWFLIVNPLLSQKYITQNGQIRFFSEAQLENIEAINNQVSSVLDLNSGKIAFTLLISAFSFEKALMQQHFNDKYMESDQWPKSKFEGHFGNPAGLLSLTETPTAFTVSGTLTIHGVRKDISVEATLQQTGAGTIKGHSVFLLKPEDFDISIPAAKRDNIAKTIEVTVNTTYEKMD